MKRSQINAALKELGWNLTDNRFYPPVGRFPTIEEDEALYRLLCNEYPAAK